WTEAPNSCCRPTPRTVRSGRPDLGARCRRAFRRGRRAPAFRNIGKDRREKRREPGRAREAQMVVIVIERLAVGIDQAILGIAEPAFGMQPDDALLAESVEHAGDEAAARTIERNRP